MYEYLEYLESGFRFRWSMKNANFLWERQLYEDRFGRKPKTWTPEQLMVLYKNAKERSVKRQKSISDVIYQAIENIKPNENGYVCLYTYAKDGDIIVHNLREDKDYGWGWSQSRLTFSKDEVKRRDEKINFLLENELAFELGEELNKRDRMRSSLHSYVMQAIREVVDTRLREEFKNTPFSEIPKIMTIDFGGTEFYAALDTASTSSWRKFELLDQVKEKTIKIH
jgi:hypothetical protein